MLRSGREAPSGSPRARIDSTRRPGSPNPSTSGPNRPPRALKHETSAPRRPNRLLVLAENTVESATPTALNTPRDAPRQAVAPTHAQPANQRSTTSVHEDRSPYRTRPASAYTLTRSPRAKPAS